MLRDARAVGQSHKILTTSRLKAATGFPAAFFPRCIIANVSVRCSSCLWWYLFTLPIPAFAPIIHCATVDDLHQLFCCKLGTEELPLFDIVPKLFTEVCLDRSGMQTDAQSIIAGARPQVVVESFGELVDSRLRSPIAVPASQAIVADRPNPC